MTTRTRPAMFLLIAALLSGCASSGPPAGAPAPALAAPDSNSQTFTLADHRGQVVLIDFWATWCPPCVQASPHIQALHEKYAANPDVEIITVYASSRGNPSEYASEHGYTYRIIPDGAPIARAWNVTSLPTFIVVGRDGEIVYSKLGYYAGDESKLDQAIQDAL